MITGGGIVGVKVGRAFQDILSMLVGRSRLWCGERAPLCVYFATGSKAKAAKKKRMDEQTGLTFCSLPPVPMSGRSQGDYILCDHI